MVPTDCLAAHPHRRLPDGTALALGFEAAGSPSPGAARTAVEGLGAGGVVRRGGEITRVPAAWRTRRVDFGAGPRTAVTIPWGDVSTAYHSTGIPDVEVYTAVPATGRRALRATRYLGPLLRAGPVRAALRWLVGRVVDGPDAAERAAGEGRVWGKATAPDGTAAVSRLRTPETYEFTARSAVECATRVRAGDAPAGFQTPSSAFGPDFVLGFEGVRRTDDGVVGNASGEDASGGDG